MSQVKNKNIRHKVGIQQIIVEKVENKQLKQYGYTKNRIKQMPKKRNGLVPGGKKKERTAIKNKNLTFIDAKN